MRGFSLFDTFSVMKFHLGYLIPTLLCGLFSSLTAHSGEPLAQPGFVGDKRCGAGFFGFEYAALAEPGIWGALLITEDQGTRFRDAWLSTWGRVYDDPNVPKEEANGPFKLLRAEILLPNQVDLVAEINQITQELLDANGGRAWWDSLKKVERRECLIEKILPLLNDEQKQNLEATQGQAP